MMLHDSLTMTIPLQTDEYGTIHISGTRITLDALIARYHEGDSPEAIQAGFEALSLHAIYAVIAYYLAHREIINAYLQHRQSNMEQLRRAWETKYPPKITKAKLLARLETTEGG